MNLAAKLDVVIVGAGAAGIGCGVVLHNLGIENFVILERHEVGASFSRWPVEMRFITPSFPSHGFGLLDLNAIALQTSPGLSLQREHLSGKEYAVYLKTAVEFFQLPVQEDESTITPGLFLTFLAGSPQVPKTPPGDESKGRVSVNYVENLAA
jgi:putative flavoprotein involved in K+ transport